MSSIQTKEISPESRFGILTVIGVGVPHTRKSGKRLLTSMCRCDCGKEVTIPNTQLRVGNNKSCGCSKPGKRSQEPIGAVHGFWTVIADLPCDRVTMCLCECICGKTQAFKCSLLRANKSKSCGCQKAAALSLAKTTHGCSRPNSVTFEYAIWNKAKHRCFNKNDKRFHRYGGRGITMCEKWRHSFEEFIKDVGIAPSRQHSIDRINNDGNYEPGNVRWATKKEQAGNTSRAVVVEVEGVSRCISAHARHYGVYSSAVFYRLSVGQTIEEALELVPCTTVSIRKSKPAIQNGEIGDVKSTLRDQQT